MELPTWKLPPTSRRSPEPLHPANSHRILILETNGKMPRVHARIRKTPLKISISAIVNLESHSIEKRTWIHFIGVGGCGLSAIAMLALKQGYAVSGSDVAWSGYMDALREGGARLYVGHSELNLRGNAELSSLPDAVVVSSAIPPENVEVLVAESSGVPLYKRDAWLGKITKNYNLIAVSGSHGKSTTTSMLAYVLKAMGDDLTAVMGAQVPQFDGSNVIYGNGKNFVLEADEYDACFLGLSPHVAIVTNVDWEHVDIFEDEEAVKTVFRRFLGNIRTGGHLILYGDRHDQSLGALSLLDHPKEVSEFPSGAESLSARLGRNSCKVTTFGMSNYNDWQAKSVSSNYHGGCDYKLGTLLPFCMLSNHHLECLLSKFSKGQLVSDISLQIPGVHNVLNSLAVVAALSAIFGDEGQLYESIDMVKSHLKSFKGVSRRFEFVGTVHGYHIFDDYAHHPTEVRAVLQAAKLIFPSKKLLVVFQPHTYSRVAAMKSEFASAFIEADQVIITEIYAARETNFWSISGKDLAMSIINPPCEFILCLDNVLDKLADMISKDPERQMVILTLGAGDITMVGRKLLDHLQQTSS